MKYPVEQFEVLIQGLKQVAKHFNVNDINPNQLHYIVYQQFSEGQIHNHIYIMADETLKRFHTMSDEEKINAEKLIDINYDFVLYPDGCDDTHVMTAMKKAIKELN